MSSRPSTAAPPRVASSSASRADMPIRAGFETGPADALQQHRLARLAEQMIAVVAGRTVDAEADTHPGIAHRAYRRDAEARIMLLLGQWQTPAAFRASHSISSFIGMHHVRKPDVVRRSSRDFRHRASGKHTELSSQKRFSSTGLGQVGMQAHAGVAARARRFGASAPASR